MRQLLLLHFSGEDKPGLTHAISEVLAAHDAMVLDIGQAVIHDLLSLGMLLEVPVEAAGEQLQKELLYCAHRLDLRVKFTPIREAEYAAWVAQQGKPRHIITVVARRLSAAHLARVSQVLAEQGLNIDILHRLSGRIPLESTPDTPYACVEFSVRGAVRDSRALHAQLMEIAHDLGIDIAWQADDLYRRNRRLIAFDMDSTLIQAEVIDELAAVAGVGEEVARITEQAMRGEIDFEQSLRRRVGLLEGLDAGVLEQIAAQLPLTEGVDRLFPILRRIGLKTAIISGGFSYFGKHLQRRLQIDYAFANELEIVEGKLSGNLLGRIVDGPRKAELLRQIAFAEQIHLNQAIAIGDGANDLPMLEAAGLGIAFRAKPIVKQSARHALSAAGLDAVLYLLGVRDREHGEGADGSA